LFREQYCAYQYGNSHILQSDPLKKILVLKIRPVFYNPALELIYLFREYIYGES